MHKKANTGFLSEIWPEKKQRRYLPPLLLLERGCFENKKNGEKCGLSDSIRDRSFRVLMNITKPAATEMDVRNGGEYHPSPLGYSHVDTRHATQSSTDHSKALCQLVDYMLGW